MTDGRRIPVLPVGGGAVSPPMSPHMSPPSPPRSRRSSALDLLDFVPIDSGLKVDFEPGATESRLN
jgi:hypothetical protein